MAGRIKYASWFFRVLSWDGVLPACVAVTPNVVGFLIPNRRGAIENAALVIPLIALILRIIFGRRHIFANHCSAAVQRFQVGMFYLGIVILGLLECFLILSHIMPQGDFKTSDYIVFAVLFFVYLTSMTIAMYPGRVSSPLPASAESSASSA